MGGGRAAWEGGEVASYCWVGLNPLNYTLRLLVTQREAALLKEEKTDLEERVALLQSKL